MKGLGITMAGYVHVYTGNGKGKTTAAFGLAVRSLYANKKVYIGQFIKSMKYHETGLEKDFDDITIEQYGQHCFIDKEPTEKDIELAREGLDKISEILQMNYDVVILDEITIALYFKLFSVDELLEVLKKRNGDMEIVITGRYAPDELIEYADLVTEMKEIKHYYKDGVLSRDGIDR
jgi:cob(I)alamin adenosyltransferase